MAIKFTSVVTKGRLVVASCDRNTPLRIRVVVCGTSRNGTERFNLEIYDINDELLQQTISVPVPNKGKFRVKLDESLSCNCDCEVSGGLDDSGESEIEVFARVIEVGNTGNTMDSNKVNLECLSSSTVSIVPKGCHADGRLVLTSAGKAAAGSDKVLVDFNPDGPDIAFFPDELDSDIRMIAIGHDDLHFPHPIHASWRLSPNELRRLTEFEGAVVAFNPETLLWEPIAGARLDGKVVTFPLYRGGFYGLLSHARYRVSCDSLLFGQPPRRGRSPSAPDPLRRPEPAGAAKVKVTETV